MRFLLFHSHLQLCDCFHTLLKFESNYEVYYLDVLLFLASCLAIKIGQCKNKFLLQHKSLKICKIIICFQNIRFYLMRRKITCGIISSRTIFLLVILPQTRLLVVNCAHHFQTRRFYQKIIRRIHTRNNSRQRVQIKGRKLPVFYTLKVALTEAQ